MKSLTPFLFSLLVICFAGVKASSDTFLDTLNQILGAASIEEQVNLVVDISSTQPLGADEIIIKSFACSNFGFERVYLEGAFDGTQIVNSTEYDKYLLKYGVTGLSFQCELQLDINDCDTILEGGSATLGNGAFLSLTLEQVLLSQDFSSEGPEIALGDLRNCDQWIDFNIGTVQLQNILVFPFPCGPLNIAFPIDSGLVNDLLNFLGSAVNDEIQNLVCPVLEDLNNGLGSMLLSISEFAKGEVVTTLEEEVLRVEDEKTNDEGVFLRPVDRQVELFDEEKFFEIVDELLSEGEEYVNDLIQEIEEILEPYLADEEIKAFLESLNRTLIALQGLDPSEISLNLEDLLIAASNLNISGLVLALTGDPSLASEVDSLFTSFLDLISSLLIEGLTIPPGGGGNFTNTTVDITKEILEILLGNSTEFFDMLLGEELVDSLQEEIQSIIEFVNNNTEAQALLDEALSLVQNITISPTAVVDIANAILTTTDLGLKGFLELLIEDNDIVDDIVILIDEALNLTGSNLSATDITLDNILNLNSSDPLITLIVEQTIEILFGGESEITEAISEIIIGLFLGVDIEELTDPIVELYVEIFLGNTTFDLNNVTSDITEVLDLIATGDLLNGTDFSILLTELLDLALPLAIPIQIPGFGVVTIEIISAELVFPVPSLGGFAQVGSSSIELPSIATTESQIQMEVRIILESVPELGGLIPLEFETSFAFEVVIGEIIFQAAALFGFDFLSILVAAQNQPFSELENFAACAASGVFLMISVLRLDLAALDLNIEFEDDLLGIISNATNILVDLYGAVIPSILENLVAEGSSTLSSYDIASLFPPGFDSCAEFAQLPTPTPSGSTSPPVSPGTLDPAIIGGIAGASALAVLLAFASVVIINRNRKRGIDILSGEKADFNATQNPMQGEEEGVEVKLMSEDPKESSA